jgi:hypothetical protein
VIVPIVQLKVDGTLEVRVIFGPAPLQVLAVLPFVTAGLGSTLTKMEYCAPAQPPVEEVGVTRYSTLPAVVFEGFVNTWLIVDPLATEAPVIPPVIVPIVQPNVLAALAVRGMFGPMPLQVVAVGEFVMAGVAVALEVSVANGVTLFVIPAIVPVPLVLKTLTGVTDALLTARI